MLVKKDITSFRSDYGKLVEVFVSTLYHRMVKPNSIVVDGGANGGMHTFPLARVVGNQGKVHAFEPYIPIYKFLENRAKSESLSSDYPQLHNVALGHEEGSISFVTYPDKPALNHKAHGGEIPSLAHGKQSVTVECPVVKLDSIVKDDDIDFIKLDLEGSEFLALLGAKNCISNNHPIVVFENARYVNANQHKYSEDDFFNLFNELDYLIFDIHGLPLVRESWLSQDISYEFIALWKGDERLSEILFLIKEFWKTVLYWPDINNWGQCPMLGKNFANFKTI